MTPSDRYLWTLPMFHANGWTFVWIVTAIGGTHVCLRKVDPAAVFDSLERESDHDAVLRADGADRDRERTARSFAHGAPRGVRVLTAGAPPAAATIERIEGELGWTITQVYGLTETAPFITICEPRDGARDADARASARRSRRGRASSSSRRASCASSTRHGATSRATARRSARSSCAATS